MKRTTDMTKGSPMRLLLAFSLPLLLTNLGQQLYIIIDAAIVGRGIGVKALAAIGSSDWTYWMLIWTIMGLTQGFRTFVSRAFGEKNYDQMNKYIAMSTILSIAIGAILTVAGIASARPLLAALKTPADIIDDAVLYLVSMTAGILVVTLYNIAAAILRAFGNGRHPLYAMTIAVILNIILDLVFVIAFKWGLLGAAIASVVSQLVSFLYCLKQLRAIRHIKITRETWRLDMPMLVKLTRFGVPVTLLYIIIAIGGIALQAAVNRQGSLFVAGFTAPNKLYGLLECTAISLGIALATFTAQNYGAGDKSRVRKGVQTGLILSLLASFAVSAITIPGGRRMLQLFIDPTLADGPQALAIGERYLFFMSSFLSVLFPIHVYRNALQALGDSMWPMISGIAETVLRITVGFIIVAFAMPQLLFYAEPAAWLFALIFTAAPYYRCQRRLLAPH
jgi:putative MATE family efflux protein